MRWKRRGPSIAVLIDSLDTMLLAKPCIPGNVAASSTP